MTITEAITNVLNRNQQGLSSKEIYEIIVKESLYHFKAKNPQNIVNVEIRRQCQDLDFPTAYKKKLFTIIKKEKNINYYGLISNSKEKFSETKTKFCTDNSDMLPEERILLAYKEHIEIIKNQLIYTILENDPCFFEKMVVDLLVKMRYGYDVNSGIVTGKSHDNGIDGIIEEDKLGLDKIYIQAKGYKSSNKVSAPEIQKFIGAMGKNNKGVFITTSSFTKEACKEAEKAFKNIQLIDGSKLSDLMLIHNIGVTNKCSFSVYQLDEDYFK